MIENHRIVPARPEHVPVLGPIERDAASLFPEAFMPKHLRGETVPLSVLADAQREGRLWVALSEDGRPVGFVIATELDGGAFVREVSVHPDYGRRGIGTALMRTVIAWAETYGYPAVTLSTFRDVPWNAPFYAKLGFEPIPDVEQFPGMVRQLRDEVSSGLNPDHRIAMRLAIR